MLFSRSLFFANAVGDVKIDDNIAQNNNDQKIFQFTSGENYTLNISTQSLDITSNVHKTYNNEGGDKFRDIIKFTLDSFFELNTIPYIQRIGLRYDDICPLPEINDNVEFSKYYNTSFPLQRFDIHKSQGMNFSITTEIEDKYFLTFVENYISNNQGKLYSFTFDGFALNKKVEEYLTITDKLHDIIVAEWEKSIKNPVYDIMNTPK